MGDVKDDDEVGFIMHERDQVAKSHGFNSFSELLDVSTRLSAHIRGPEVSYLARHPKGHWFIWVDPFEEVAEELQSVD